MKWVNPGAIELFDYVQGRIYTYKPSEVSSYYPSGGTQTGIFIRNTEKDGSSGRVCSFMKTFDKSYDELWISFDMSRITGIAGWGGLRFGFITESNQSIYLLDTHIGSFNALFEVTNSSKNIINCSSYDEQILYTPEKSVNFTTTKPVNIEVHIAKNRIDLWSNHKLLFSYRSPSFCNEKLTKFFFLVTGNNTAMLDLSSFIIQDTRRIGYEKFVKLNIDPSTEQNMPQGSTTNYTLSGLSDSSEYSDITGVVAMLQATSRDANISTGTYTLNGADVGTIDVSDSSGRAYELAHAETNSLTGLPFTRDDIEGKTLSFTVNGAS